MAGCGFAAVSPPSGLLAQRNLKDIPDPDPLTQLAELDVHRDFEINLYAADPRIAKPIQMNFDPAGRLWVASSEVYPQIEPGKKATDKILVIEDQDRDGTADTTTVFKNGLLIPTGVVPGDGGAYVANSTELLHLKDTTGDGVADTERVMLSGFGTEDTHHILHTLRWGPEGLLYMNQSIYIHSHIETPYGVRRMNGGGVWHLRPETMELEAYTFGLVNPWGHVIDEYGQSFETDGAGGEGINYVFPDFVGLTSPGAKRIMGGLNPGKPKLCGLEIVGGSHLPDSWQGKLITNDFRAHRVCVYNVEDDGAGFASKELAELVKTRHQSFRPIDVKLGPDGAIYIADWYNPIIQHGEVDFRDPRRDHTHGRIWRIKAKDRPLLPFVDLTKLNEQQLLDLLRTDEPYWRQQARRVLKERGRDKVLPAIAAIRDNFADRHELELLWVYQSMNEVNADLLTKLLKHSDAKIRAGATRVLYHWQDRVPQKMELLQTLAQDEHPRVRMEAAHALRRCKEVGAGLVALTAIEKPSDKFLDYALQQTADITKEKWLPAMRDGELAVPDDPSVLLFALKAADSADAVPLLLKALPSWEGNATAIDEVMQLVAARGNPDELSQVFDRAVVSSDNEAKALLLNALIEANQRRKLRPNSDLNKLKSLLTSKSPDVTAAAAELAGLWQLSDTKDAVFSIASSSQADQPTRQAAIRGLAAMQQAALLQKLNADGNSPAIRIAAISGLAKFDTKAAATAAAGLLTGLKESDDPATLVRSFLSQEGADAALVAAFDPKSSISPDVAKICIRAARTSGRNVDALVQRLQEAGGLNTEIKLTAAERDQLLADVAKSGNPANGESIYRLSDLNCQKCHAIGGAGGKVGPDLGSIGASAPADYILESLLDPGAKIKENYHSQVVATDEGEVITGVMLRETKDSLILRDAEDKEISIPLDSIEARKDGGSLMPAGLLNELTRSEMIDLVSFLTELGKVGGDFAVSNKPVVRSWETLSATVDAKRVARRTEAQIAKETSMSWQAEYSLVRGELPTDGLPSHRARGADGSASYIRFPIEMTTDGVRTLTLSRLGRNVRIFVDGELVRTKSPLKLELSKGKHSVMMALDVESERLPIGVGVE